LLSSSPDRSIPMPMASSPDITKKNKRLQDRNQIRRAEEKPRSATPTTKIRKRSCDDGVAVAGRPVSRFSMTRAPSAPTPMSLPNIDHRPFEGKDTLDFLKKLPDHGQGRGAVYRIPVPDRYSRPQGAGRGVRRDHAALGQCRSPDERSDIRDLQPHRSRISPSGARISRAPLAHPGYELSPPAKHTRDGALGLRSGFAAGDPCCGNSPRRSCRHPRCPTAARRNQPLSVETLMPPNGWPFPGAAVTAVSNRFAGQFLSSRAFQATAPSADSFAQLSPARRCARRNGTPNSPVRLSNKLARIAPGFAR